MMSLVLLYYMLFYTKIYSFSCIAILSFVLLLIYNIIIIAKVLKNVMLYNNLISTGF